ncbi:hypothetical protein DPMN_133221 [Dreissena polymorpha]|uniref:Uncharacterized protein n=1 Tax=Dreissena polymorpha TaxID=45954 RepID=A0A9D4FXH3_DREPO|nr:hypothetical protein DPMN_133221 [Dreissena polymorpha]
MIHLLDAANNTLKKVQNIADKSLNEMQVYLKQCKKDLKSHTDKCKHELDDHTSKCTKAIDGHASKAVESTYEHSCKEMLLLGSEGAVESVETDTVDNGSCAASATSPQLKMELLLSTDLQKTGDEDQDPFLTGLDFLPDGKLVAINNRNMKCIIMDNRLQRLGTPYKFKSNPDDVACISQNKVAVTMSNKTICFLTVSPKYFISLTRHINSSSYVDSICMMNKSTMLGSCYHDVRPARMISIDGTESDFVKVVYEPKTYNIGGNKCTFVASKNTLVMTDRFAHTIFFFDVGTGVARIITNTTIQEPRGVCVGLGDTVLVSSMGTHSIVQLNVKGDLLSVYPVDIKNPFNLCTSTDGTRLAITNGGVRLKQLCLYTIQANAPQA